MIVVEDGKAGFIQRGAMAMGAGTPAVGSCSGREIGLSSEHSTGRWGFIAKEQGWGRWVENS